MPPSRPAARHLSRALCLLALLLTAPAIARAELLWSRSFESETLGRAMPYSVYLPMGYHDPRQAETRYPVVYLLHGVGDNERAWPAYGQVERTVDRMLAMDELAPVIIVMPAGRKSWWVNSAEVDGAGDYETAVTRDLRRHVETTYRARTDRDGRFVAGLSMGGYGALRLALGHPDLYRAAGAMSSALWMRARPGWSPPPAERMARIFDGSFGTPWNLDRFLTRHPAGLIAGAKAWVERTGQPLDLYLQAGDDDGFGAHLSTMEFYTLLRDDGFKPELRIDDGGHTWPLWRAALGPLLSWFDGLSG